MTKKQILSAVICAASMAFGSSMVCGCKKGAPEDTTKPVIDLIEPEDGDALRIGGAGVHFEMKLSDDQMVKSYKLEMHNAFDGHSHRAAETRHGADAAETVPFFFMREYPVNQRNATIHHHDIVIPANAAPGSYHLMVYCVDAAGNEAVASRTVVLSEDAPEHDHDHD